MLIGVNGFKGSGKDTIGDYLVSQHDFKRDAFADRLKLAVGVLLGMTLEEIEQAKNNSNTKVTVSLGHVSIEIPFRLFLKRFGTEAGRNIYGYDHWLNLVLPDPKSDNYLPGIFNYNRRMVITDARFVNEAKRIKDLNGYIINVSRPGYEGDEHISEHPLDLELIDFFVRNDGSIEELHTQVEDVLDKITKLEYKHAAD